MERTFITLTADPEVVIQLRAGRHMEHLGRRYRNVVIHDVEYPLERTKRLWSFHGFPEG